ncbi:MAG: hypothetical protein JNK21_07265 [Rhodospirillaceae bacterium]|nr:hypothetical protein [Rhodospirillaceae bacterium]
MHQPVSEEALKAAYQAGLYFFSPENLLTHNSGCIIEGLMDLGLKVRANTAKITSRDVSQPLTGVDAASLVSPPAAGYAAFVIDISHGNTYVPLDSLKGGRLAYLTNSDISLFCEIPEPYPLFAVHESTFAKKAGRRFALAFGPSNGLIAATEHRMDFNKRKRTALRNFRPTFSQGVRGLLDIAFVPRLKSRIDVEARLLPPQEYLQALMGAQVCLAYGGDFYSSQADNAWLSSKQPALYQQHTFKTFTEHAIVMRWDSWRFWESLMAGCLTVHLDFAKYGFDLPVKPEPWVHYAPLDLDNLTGSIAALFDHEKQWAEIAESGRTWALENYAPRPTAARFLSQLL